MTPRGTTHGRERTRGDDEEPTTPRSGGRRLVDVRTAAPRVPRDVTSPHAKLVYLYLWFRRRADVGEISGALGLPQIRLYPVLECLVRSGHVYCAGSVYSLERRAATGA